MYKKLTEAINVENANHIGTAHGYDVFDILTYEAAQQFTVENRNDLAGAAYTQNANTFNNNINNSQHLYFFVRENTNQVYGAVVKSADTHSDVKFVSSKNTSITVRCNFLYENAGENSSKTYYDKPFPFFLIPDATFNGQQFGCLYVDDSGTIKAALPQFNTTDDNLIDLSDLPDTIHSIDANAFDYGLEVSNILLGENITYLPTGCMKKVHNEILVTMFEAPTDWDEGWNAEKENITTYAYGTDPEIIARHEQEVAAAQEAERLRREEEARRAAEREARKLRYKVKGKEVVITGTISGISRLDIPEEIEGKPVTTIAAYAFFEETDLEIVNLPRTLKLIEQGAFYGSGVYRIEIPKKCIVGKYNNNVRIIRRYY